MRITAQLSSSLAIVLALASCANTPGADVSSTDPEPQRKASTPPRAAFQVPGEFGVYYESAEGLRPLMANATVAPKSPTFIVYLEKLPPAEKMILRFGIGTGPNYFSVKSGELAGVFDAKMSPVDGHPEVYRATYLGVLKPGKYMAYTFTDVSKGAEPWAEAQFQYAGTIEVGK